LAEAQYTVTGMTCGHCEASVRGEVSKIAGVESVQASAASGVLTVVSSREVGDEEILAAVDEAGYAAARSR